MSIYAPPGDLPMLPGRFVAARPRSPREYVTNGANRHGDAPPTGPDGHLARHLCSRASVRNILLRYLPRPLPVPPPVPVALPVLLALALALAMS